MRARYRIVHPSRRPDEPALLPALLLLAGLVAGCSGDSVEVTDRPDIRTRDERVAAEHAVLQVEVNRIRAAGMHVEVMGAIDRLLEEHPRLAEELEVAIPGGSVAWKDVQHYATWNRPGPGRSAIAALDFERENHPYGIILSYARQLAERDIDLLVVPVPSRLQVYPERLPGVEPREEFAGGSPGTACLLLALAEQGVEIVDLLSVFGARRDAEADPLFHGFDSHWTPSGASLAADVIAARLRQMDWFEPGALEPGVDFQVVRERGPFDLYAKLAKEPANVLFERILNDAGGPAHEPDRSSPILLIGDSFAGQYAGEACDLASLLFARTGRRIDTITLSGGGASRVWEAIRRRGDELAGKRVVIWVFTARVLGSPTFEAIPIFPD